MKCGMCEKDEAILCAGCAAQMSMDGVAALGKELCPAGTIDALRAIRNALIAVADGGGLDLLWLVPPDAPEGVHESACERIDAILDAAS